jgi:anti-anti-sigma factor
MNANPLFEVEQVRRTVVATAFGELDEFTFDEVADEAGGVFELLNKGLAENVVLDLHRVQMCQSTAFGFLLRAAKRVQERGGKMALCNLSEHTGKAMRALNLDKVWAICDSRDDAIAEVEA